MKKLLLLLTLTVALFAEDIVVFHNEYQVLELQKKVKKLIVGNQKMINVSLLESSRASTTLLKIFGKKTGNTSILIVYRDNSIQNYHVYINENLGFVQKMINIIEPTLKISRVGDGSTVLEGQFKDPHNKTRIFSILQNSGVDMKRLMDLTTTKKVNKMIRTKLYLVEINNNRAEDLGGVTGLGFFNEYLNLSMNPSATNGVTFSGWLLNNAGQFSTQTGNSISGTLNFLQTKGIAKILDDTVLMTTEDQNATFRVGGEVYIPVGLTQNVGYAPTIQVEEKEYGLRLTLTSNFLEKDGYMHLDIHIKDSEFDTNKEHDVQLGKDIFVPSFVSKNIETNVVVKSGQIVALGGRLHTENADTEEKVPLLGDIPVLGELFKHTVTKNKTSDLLFFLVPEIVDANDAIDDSHFYPDFKEEAKQFHKTMMEKSPKPTPQPKVVQVTPSKEPEQKLENEPMINEPIIEVEPQNSEEISQQQEAIEPTEESVQETPKTADTTLPLYEVDIQNIYLREAPLDGKQATIWSQGHTFKADGEVEKGGIVWLKVVEDCKEDCKVLEQPLWISKKYTKKI